MLVSMEYENILKNQKDYTLVDMRCPREYAEATIPSAINIPLFGDEEYAQIGITYKNAGKEASVRLGMDYISKSLPGIYDAFCKIRENRKKMVLFCARGGMRSSSIGALLQSLGMPVVKMDKGYKGYRQYVNQALPKLIEKFSFISLYGKTGSGKTYILDEIAKLGYPVLDLEKCANHRGSLLGGIGLGACNSQKMFESLVFDTLYGIDAPYVFTEGESKRIGKIIMPDALYNAVSSGDRLLIHTDIKKRVENVRKEYITDKAPVNEIIAAVESMETYIGPNRVAEYGAMIRQGEYDAVIEALMLRYYDNAYSTKDKNFNREFTNIQEALTAKELIVYANEKYSRAGVDEA